MMEKTDPLIHTKLHLPFTRSELVDRPRLYEQIAQGLRGPLTLVTAPAGFGKTTLVASHIAACGMPVAWLSLDKNDNQAERFLQYLVAALQEIDPEIGKQAAQLMASARQEPVETILTSLINDIDATGREMAVVLDDYQFISNQGVHEAMGFLLQHCPKTFHLVIATRSDPPLSLSRLRARGQTVELRAADLRFTQPEAAQFLNEVMGLNLDAEYIVALEEHTEGWIVGLQMAALSMRDRKDLASFIEGFSGTNRYILDYLLEEVLASQPPEIQRFLLFTSILERLAAPLCDAILADDEGLKSKSTSILEYVEKANLFLIPLDDERIWYRYHHLFADLLSTQLQRLLGAQGIAQLHIRASEWHGSHGSVLEAINHASLASDEERVEHYIEQSYMEMVSRGEMAWMRVWRGKLSKDLVYRRPWLCIYEAYSHAWYGELDEVDLLLEKAEKRIRSGVSVSEAHSMEGLLAYVKSRVTAMRGDMPGAIELCLEARQGIPASNLALQFDTSVTLGYIYFLTGDYANASRILNETIRAGIASSATIHIVAASCIMARLYAIQGLLHKSYATYQMAAQQIPETSDEHRDARALVEVGIADVLCERNNLEAALVHLQQGLTLLPLWAKVDDLVLANITLARIRLAQANRSEASEAVEKAIQIIRTYGVFCEARKAAEITQVKLWLLQGDLQAAHRWVSSQEERLCSDHRFGFDNELTHITRVRVLLAQNNHGEALDLLSHLEETARAAGRMGRVIEILLLQALALREIGDSEQARLALTKCLTLAEPEGYLRIFLDEGQPMQMLLAQWLAHAGAGQLRDYAISLLSQFEIEPFGIATAKDKGFPARAAFASPGQSLAEPLSERELEVLHLIALGRTNQEIARQLIVAPGTIKSHTASIYRKLDVANRTEAVARARQLGILP